MFDVSSLTSTPPAGRRAGTVCRRLRRPSRCVPFRIPGHPCKIDEKRNQRTVTQPIEGKLAGPPLTDEPRSAKQAQLMACQGLRGARHRCQVANAQLGRLGLSLRLKRKKHRQARGVRENRQEFRHLADTLRLRKCAQSLSYGVDVNDVNLTAVRAQLLLQSFTAIIACEPTLRGVAAADNM